MSTDLRRNLERIADRSPGVGPAALIERVDRQLAGEPTTGLVAQSVRRFPNWAVAAAAAAVVIVVIGGAILLIGGGDDVEIAGTTTPPATTSPSATTSPGDTTLPPGTTTPPATTTTPPTTVTATTVVTIAQPPMAARLGTGWVPTHESERGDLWDVTRLPDGGLLVAGLGSSLLRSDDGIVWTDADGAGTIESDAGFLSVAATNGEVTVVAGHTCEGEGCGPQEHGVWWSGDGSTWQKVSPDGEAFYSCAGVAGECYPSVEGLVGSAEGFLATGALFTNSDPSNPAGGTNELLVWQSDDGAHWRRLTTPDPPALGLTDLQAAVDDPAVGTWLTLSPVGRVDERTLVWLSWETWRYADDTWDHSGVMLMSADGETWDIVSGFDATAQSLSVAGSVLADGILVVAGSAGGEPATWTTADGFTWIRGDMPREITSGPIVDVAHVPGLGFIGVADPKVIQYETGDVEPELTEAGPVLWHSTDGTTWFGVETVDLDFGTFRALAGSGSTLVAVGGQWPPDGGGDPRMGIWTRTGDES